MIRFAALIASLAIAGCAHQITAYPTQPPMKFGVNTAMKNIMLNVVWHESVESLHKACEEGKRGEPGLTYGCAELKMSGPISPTRCSSV